MQHEKGDTVALIGTFSYSRKTSKNDSDRIVYFENVIVDDMAVIKRKTNTFAEGFGDFEEAASTESEETDKIEKKS